ncbi:alpha/beta fold hydrolase [Kribbella qitaiheensis]|uniref:alpha/beta fold hydrolase n=1 Tax=Kribbella qitaiheensis TaxID=1544730 RepID=UPI0019D52A7B
MATFILVPGGWRGAWSYDAVVPHLERAGHTVHALTLTGLRPDDDIATIATANLDTHADDVLQLLDREHITDATLVGHSYGGMVIAAAADRAGGPDHPPGPSRRLRPTRRGVMLVSNERRLPAVVRQRRCDHRLRRPPARRRRSPHPPAPLGLVPAGHPPHRRGGPSPPPRVRLLLRLGRHTFHRTPHPPRRGSRVAGPPPSHRPRRNARGTRSRRCPATRRTCHGRADARTPSLSLRATQPRLRNFRCRHRRLSPEVAGCPQYGRLCAPAEHSTSGKRSTDAQRPAIGQPSTPMCTA